MEFFDSFDYNYTNKKCSQIHSWYLYEQYKSLEKNQLDAAKKLKERCSQERLLQQELSERRAKRGLYDQHDQRFQQQNQQMCNNSSTMSFAMNVDDFYDEVRGVYVEDAVYLPDVDIVRPEEIGLLSESYSEKVKRQERSGDSSSAASVDDERDGDLVAQDLAKRLEFVKKNIEERECSKIQNITYIDRSGGVAKCSSTEVVLLPGSEDEGSKDDIAKRKFFFSLENSESIFRMWSKLVCFAYQVIQFNPGNCYSDSTCQLLLTILACDAVKKGFYEICTFLQSYVSPIAFETDATPTTHKNSIPKLCTNKKYRRGYLSKSMKFSKNRKYGPDNRSQKSIRRCKGGMKGKNEACFGDTFSTSLGMTASSSGYVSSSSFDEYLLCPGVFPKKMKNPMSRLVRYMDEVLSKYNETREKYM